ncbi:SO_0444 family Cu/Zn efflux transporter [Desulfonatronum sp. SC1]|uniref:SO_0444 family Cu/Zn efflux transporter n=1 Tax=Desulfonatronum sp. SC1 TaxID=2109626 RepID=UPI0018EE877C|nr:SO_0444 family Cu/Zn efflux transporter [Desulfonatronum sp. SC1]
MDWVLQVALAGWDVLVASAPYMLLGFFFAGVLKAFLPDDLVARHLGTSSFSGLIKAAAVGVPIPLCSCGVLPTAAGLRRQGAAKGPTAAFLISTPETGVDSIAVTWALLDPFMTIVRPLSAFFTALVTGTMVQALDRSNEPPALPPSKPQFSPSPSPSPFPSSSPCLTGAGCGCATVQSQGQSQDHKPDQPPAKTSALLRLRAGMAFAFGDLFRDIAPWFLLGVLIAGGISVWLTPEMVSRWLGNPVLAMVVMLVISVPLYVCATASTPIAAALVLKGLNPGAALVFLLAGPAVNAVALTVITKILGRRATVIYVSGIVICTLGLGLMVDWIYGQTDFMVGALGNWRIGADEEEARLVGVASAVVLLGVFAWSWTAAFTSHNQVEHVDLDQIGQFQQGLEPRLADEVVRSQVQSPRS